MHARAFAVVLVLSLLLVSVPGASASPPRVVAEGAPTATASSTPAIQPSAANSAWTLRGTQSPPRDAHGFVYDSKADEFILFGGLTSTNGATNSTWTYDYGTNTWTNVTPVVGPSPRAGFAMVYDAHADRVIVFGGTTSPGVFTDETWIFDLGNDTWTQRLPSLAPSARIIPGFAYDVAADRTILYGGQSLSNFLADTWAYDFAGNTWTQLSTSGPGGLYFASMTYDSAAKRDLLFGGFSLSGSVFTPHFEIWSFDYASLTWTNRNPTSHPTARGGAAFAFDRADDHAILFGGVNSLAGSATVYNDTWAYNYTLNGWSNVTPVVGPAARLLAAMDYDVSANRTVLFGGATFTGVPYDDAWAYGYGLALPTAPRNLQAAAGVSQITLTWQAPVADGGSSITNYRIYRGATSGGETLLTTVGTTPTYLDTAVSVGQTYYYEVAAVTAAGEGPKSNEASATPNSPPTAPSAPQSLAAAPGNAQVVLTWQAPASDGGAAITGYKVYRATTSGAETLLASPGPVLTYTDLAVTNGQPYYYEVSAVNGVGEGPKSSEVSATPRAPPTAPLQLVATAGDAQVVLTWQAPSSNGGSAITDYKVYRGTASGGEVVLGSQGTALTYTDGALTNGQTYYYQVSATNAAGEGPRSSEVHATPVAAADTTLPMVAITSPANNSVLTSTTATVTGTASDNVALQKVELSTDGSTWALATGTTSWSGVVALVTGANTIYVRATDTSGNTRTVRITVTVQTSGPTVLGLDPVLLAGILIVVVVAVMAVALILWRRRKRPAPPPEGGTP